MTSFSIGQTGTGLLAGLVRDDAGAKNCESFCTASVARFPRYLRGASAADLEREKSLWGVAAGYSTEAHCLECR